MELPDENPFTKDLSCQDRDNHFNELQQRRQGVTQRSLLLDLPTELQLMIWEFALIEYSKHQVGTGSTKLLPSRLIAGHPREVRCNCKAPGLLSVCQSIRNEATPIYYCNSMFLCPEGGYWPLEWAYWLAPETQEMIKDLRTGVHLLGFVNPLSTYYRLLLLFREATELNQFLDRSYIRLSHDALKVYVDDAGVDSALSLAEIESRMRKMAGNDTFERDTEDLKRSRQRASGPLTRSQAEDLSRAWNFAET